MKSIFKNRLDELQKEYQALETTSTISGAIIYRSGVADSGGSGSIGDERVKINVERFGFGATSTVSRFTMTAYDERGNVISTLTGYFLEPVYDPERATTANSDTAILGGTYSVIPTFHKGKSGFFEVKDVNGRSAIHIHSGNVGEETEGCLLTGSSYSYDSNSNEYRVNQSGTKMEEFRSFINNYGSGMATMNIHP